MAELEFWEQHYELDIRTQRHVVCVVTYSCGPEINFQTVLLPGTGLIIPEGNYPICGYIPDLRPTLLSHPEKLHIMLFSHQMDVLCTLIQEFARRKVKKTEILL